MNNEDLFAVEGYRWATIPELVLYSPELSDRDKVIFGVLTRFSGLDGGAFPSRKTIADLLKTSVDTIDRGINSLINSGFVSVKKRDRPNGSRTTSLYVLWPKNVVDGLYIPQNCGTPAAELRNDNRRIAAPIMNINERELYKDTTVVLSNDDPLSESSTREQTPTTPSRAKNKYSDEFSEFWKLYPRKAGKDVAAGKFVSVLKEEGLADIMLATENYAAEIKIKGTDSDFILHAKTFLSKNRWKDYLPVEEFLSPEQKTIAGYFEAYDNHEEWYDEKSGACLLDNPLTFGYTRPRNSKDQLVDSDGVPYKLDAQGIRRSIEED
jgi:hypothetical protein